MKAIGLLGSPRKGWNSDMALDAALEGAVSVGAEAEKICLFDLKYSGCRSCFACKRLGGPSFARCALRDDLTGVLDTVLQADVLIISAPLYYWSVPGQVRSFYERILFPPNLYSPDRAVNGYDRSIATGLIYTMGMSDPKDTGDPASRDRVFFNRHVGPTEALNIVDCYQFDDYSKYSSTLFDVEAKIARRVNEFPTDLQHAHELGIRLVKTAEACR